MIKPTTTKKPATKKATRKKNKIIKNWIKGTPTVTLLDNCCQDVFKMISRMNKRKKKPTHKQQNDAYSRILRRHVKIVDNNIGVSKIVLEWDGKGMELGIKGKMFDKKTRKKVTTKSKAK